MATNPFIRRTYSAYGGQHLADLDKAEKMEDTASTCLLHLCLPISGSKGVKQHHRNGMIPFPACNSTRRKTGRWNHAVMDDV